MVTALTRRLVATVAVIVFVAGACGADSDNANDASPSDVGGSLSTSTQPGLTATIPGRPGTTARSRGTATSSRNGGPGDSPADNRPAGDSAARLAAQGPPGAFAGVLLAAGPADDLVLDVLVQPGASADAGAIAQIRELLASASGKSVGVRGPTTLNSSKDVHDADDIRRLSDDQGKPAQGDGVAVIHLLYLDGRFTEEGALGVAVRGDVFAVFPDQIAGAATPFVSRERIERAVVTHELGHILGLVDLYLDERRDDSAHPGHSPNRQSVMYWAVESDLVTQVLGGPPPVDFDSADQADLRKIRDGAPSS